MESRGFLFGVPLAYQLNAGFIPVRKPGKLPAAVHKVEYELEYGTDSLEIHQDALENHHSVLIVDDLIATGGNS
jgi:adenine phosphoribosyltransferase